MKKKNEIKIFSSTLVTMLALSPFAMLNLDTKETGKPIKKVQQMIDKDTNYIQDEEIQKLLKEKEGLKQKNDILNNYSKCDTLEKIFKRQAELESLNLTDDDKLYKDCPLSPEIQRFMYEQSTLNGIPFDFLLSVIHVESRGNFNSSGQIGYNSPTSHDLGLTQQNTISSLPNFMKTYDVNYEDGYNLLKDNDYANVCAALLVCNEINNQFDEFDPYEYAGCYNGWLKWRNYSVSREYVSMFKEVYGNVYNNYHTVYKENDNVKKKIKK